MAHDASNLVKHSIKSLHFEISQTLGGVKPIIASERRAFFVDRIGYYSQSFSTNVQKGILFAAIPRSGLEILVFGGMIIWVLVGIASGENFASLVPSMGVIAVAAYRVMPSLQLIFSQVGAMNALRRSLDEITQLLQEQDSLSSGEQSLPDRSEIVPLEWHNELRFESVSFQYEGAREPVIRDLNLTIAKGQRVALVGPTGSGKSTFVDLLLGLLQPTSGRILVDGHPIGVEQMPAWRRSIGYVPQEIYLLDGPIDENIAFGLDAAQIDRQRLAEVIDLAQARDFVDSEGTAGGDPSVGERGIRLSGGQKQRLALARALYPQPQMLVLDEATSALDYQTEQKVVEKLNNENDKITIVSITHRLNTVQDFDCIYCIKNGVITNQGDYDSITSGELLPWEVADE